MPVSLNKLSLINYLIFPCIFALSTRLACFIRTFIEISIRKRLFSLPMFQKVLEVAFISLAICTDMNSVTFYFALVPLTDVTVSFLWLPYSWSMLGPIPPFSFVFLPVLPYKNTLPMPHPIFKLALVVSLGRNFVSFIFVIVDPFPFELGVVTDGDSSFASLVLGNTTEIQLLVID